MNHVVSSVADSVQMTLPVGRVFAHEFADYGEDGEGGERERPPIELESGSNIDIIQLSLFQFALVQRARLELF